jgi:hypothetical protein
LPLGLDGGVPEGFPEAPVGFPLGLDGGVPEGFPEAPVGLPLGLDGGVPEGFPDAPVGLPLGLDGGVPDELLFGLGDPVGLPDGLLSLSDLVFGVPDGFPFGWAAPVGFPFGLADPVGFPFGLADPVGFPFGLAVPVGLALGAADDFPAFLSSFLSFLSSFFSSFWSFFSSFFSSFLSFLSSLPFLELEDWDPEEDNCGTLGAVMTKVCEYHDKDFNLFDYLTILSNFSGISRLCNCHKSDNQKEKNNKFHIEEDLNWFNKNKIWWVILNFAQLIYSFKVKYNRIGNVNRIKEKKLRNEKELTSTSLYNNYKKKSRHRCSFS